MFLDFAEDQARRRKQIFMRDWRARLDDFLRFNERKVLPGAGHVPREEADRHALEEYRLFHQLQLAEIEAQAEENTLRQLSEMARKLPTKKARKKKGEP